MKHYIVVYIFILIPCIIIGQQYQTPQMPCAFHIHNYNHAAVEQENKNSHHSEHISTPTNITTQTQQVQMQTNLQQQLYDWSKQKNTQCQNIAHDIINWIESNKIISIGLGLCAGYSSINYQIYQANRIINDPCAWSNWHHNKSLEELFAIPQDQLETDLLFTIQSRYVHPTNPTDFVYPLIQTSLSLQKEMHILQEQITRYQWIQKCSCMTLFFINLEQITNAQEKYKKLCFIKHLFTSWCAHYKIEKNH